MQELLELLNINLPIGWLVVLLIISALIEISPIKFNPLQAVYNFFTAHKKILDKIDTIDQRITKLESDHDYDEAKHEEEMAELSRLRIIEFGDGISHGHLYSEERFNMIIDDIDSYERYCESHPNFKNNKAGTNIAIVKNTYKKCKTGELKFLEYDK